ncbi:MAG: hypothetical protein V3U35_08370, partial [Candidatus Neomarinimicrobiota bacterium]
MSFTLGGRYARWYGGHKMEFDSRSIMLGNQGDEHRTSHGAEVSDYGFCIETDGILLEELTQTYWQHEFGQLKVSPSGHTAWFPKAILLKTPRIEYAISNLWQLL